MDSPGSREHMVIEMIELLVIVIRDRKIQWRTGDAEFMTPRFVKENVHVPKPEAGGYMPRENGVLETHL